MYRTFAHGARGYFRRRAGGTMPPDFLQLSKRTQPTLSSTQQASCKLSSKVATNTNIVEQRRAATGCCVRSLLETSRVRRLGQSRQLSAITANASSDFPLVSFSRTSEAILGGDSPFAAVFPEVITQEEESLLLRELDPVFGRKRYEWGHWDSVIEDYKESERLDGSWSPRCQGIVDSIRNGLQLDGEAEASWLPVHAIDLSPSGFIRPHVDSVKFSGSVVAGLSLSSSAVMQLSLATNSDVADLLLPPRSLYVLRGPARFEWAHAILPNDGGPIKWQGREFERGRRVSLIFRDTLVGSPPDPHPGSMGTTTM